MLAAGQMAFPQCRESSAVQEPWFSLVVAGLSPKMALPKGQQTPCQFFLLIQGTALDFSPASALFKTI